MTVGCGWLSGPEAPSTCQFPDGAPLAFAGEATLNELGLGDGSNFDDRIGQIYVSRDPLPFTGSIPYVPGDPVVVPDHRQVCALYDDASSISSVPDDWTPPDR